MIFNNSLFFRSYDAIALRESSLVLATDAVLANMGRTCMLTENISNVRLTLDLCSLLIQLFELLLC